MNNIIAALDASEYADNICSLAIWAANNNDTAVTLLHVAKPHYDFAAKSDLSGNIGLDANNNLLDELAQIDQQHGKEEQEKGYQILEHASDKLTKAKIKEIETLHLRGSLLEVMNDLEEDAGLFIMGKHGEDMDKDKPEYLGANLEDIARKIKKPLLIANKKESEIKKFLLAYDGSEKSKKALDYICNNNLLKNLECHVIKICEKTGKAENILNEAKDKLTNAGFNVIANIKEGKNVIESINEYITENNIDLLSIGSYGHSKIRNLFFGSSTTALLVNTDICVLLF